jgi:N-methylhydantoinase A
MVRPIDGIDAAERDRLLDELRSEGRRVLAAAGATPSEVRFRYGIDARYVGQGNEITVSVGEGDQWPATVDTVRALFEAEYRRVYGLTIPDIGIEAVTWRLSAFTTAREVDPQTTFGSGVAKPHAKRPVIFFRGQAAVETDVYRRHELGVGQILDGPVIVEERETTCVVRPGWTVTVASDGSLIAERRQD